MRKKIDPIVRKNVISLMKDYIKLREVTGVLKDKHSEHAARLSNLRKTLYVAAREVGYSYGTTRRMIAEAKTWS